MTTQNTPPSERAKSEAHYCGNCQHAPFKKLTQEQEHFLQDILAMYGVRRLRNWLKKPGVIYSIGTHRTPDLEKTQAAQLIQKPQYCSVAEAKVFWPEIPCARWLPEP